MNKLKSTRQLSDEILTPLIRHYNAGNSAEVLKLFNQGLREPVLRSVMHKWLMADPKKRQMPSAGSLLRLLEVWREIRGTDAENRIEPTVYCAANGCSPSHSGMNCLRCGRRL